MQVVILGTGLMGAAIARRLLVSGHSVTVWNRTRAKAEALVVEGARAAPSPAEAVRGGAILLLTLTDAQAIEDVLGEALDHLEGRTIVQMSTIAPAESRELAELVRDAGASYLEAPMLGSTPQAKEGDLILMLGGEPEVVESVRPLLMDLSPNPRHVGGVGKAAALKLALNQILVTHVASFSLSLGMVLRADVPVEDFVEIVGGSSLRSPQFDKKLPRMIDRDFSHPHFPVAHMLKDVGLIREEADRLGLNTAALEGVEQIIARALEMGYVEVDYSALYNAVNPPAD